MKKPIPTREARHGREAFGLLELLIALALLALTSAVAVHAAVQVRRATALAVAAATFVSALGDARLLAYTSSETATVTAPARTNRVVLLSGSKVIGETTLPDGVIIADAPRRGEVRFYPSGLADNASWTLAPDGDSHRGSATVVVNQRSVIHHR